MPPLLLALFAAVVVLCRSAATATNASSVPTCPPAGFDTVPDFDVFAFATSSWFAQKQVPLVYQRKQDLNCVKATYRLINPHNVTEGLDVFNYANRGKVNGATLGAGFPIIALPSTTLTISELQPLISAPETGNSSTAASKLVVGPKRQAAAIHSPLRWAAASHAFGNYWVVGTGPSPNSSLKYDWVLVSGGPPEYSTNTSTSTNNSRPSCTTFNPMLPTSMQYNGGLWILARKPVDPAGAAAAVSKATDLGIDTSQLVDVEQEGCTYQGSV